MMGPIQQERLPDTEACSALFERVLASATLMRARRLQKLLAYVGHRVLKDNCTHISEQEIGSAIFGRPENYDTSTDNIVRVYASDLRKHLKAYFETEGLQEPLIMEIPPGSYVPIFGYRPAESKAETAAPANGHPPFPDSPDALHVVPVPPLKLRRVGAGRIVAGLLMAALAIGCVALWMQSRAMYHALYPWRSTPAVASLWSVFMDSSRDTDVVLSDDSFLLLQQIDKKTTPFDSYLNRSYINSLDSSNLHSEVDFIQGLIASKNLGSTSEFQLAQRILGVDPLGRKFHLYSARQYTPRLLKQHNVILIGTKLSNPWEALFENQMNFVMHPILDKFGSTVVTNRAPAAGEQPSYLDSDTVGYCVLAYLPKSASDGSVLLIAGTSSTATDAAEDFLLREDIFSKFRAMTHAMKLPYFEILLKTSQVSGTPLSGTIQAYRVYPNL